MSFLLILVGFLEKGTKSAKYGQFRGLTPRRRDPTQQRRSTLSRGMSTPRLGRVEGLRHSVAVLSHGVATVHSMETVVFCFVLFFRCSEDLSIEQREPYKCMKGSIHVCKVKEKLDRTSPSRRSEV